MSARACLYKKKMKRKNNVSTNIIIDPPVHLNITCYTCAPSLITSYSIDTMAAMILGLKLDHFTKGDVDDFTKAMTAVLTDVRKDFCGVAVSSESFQLLSELKAGINLATALALSKFHINYSKREKNR